MDDIVGIQRRTRAYWFIDGIAEIVGGLALAGVGAALYLTSATGEDVFATAGLLGMIVAFPLSAKLVGWLKDRLTHPRTGYVKYPEPTARRRGASAIVAALLGVAFAVLAVNRGEAGLDGTIGTAMTVAAGSAIAIGLVVRARKLEAPRFYFSGAVVAVAAAAAAVRGLDFNGALGQMWIALGLASVVTGASALLGYLRATRGTQGAAS